MAMSWGTALGSMDDSLERLLARRQAEQSSTLQVLQQVEQQRAQREQEARLREAADAQKAYYDQIGGARVVDAETRARAAETKQTELEARQKAIDAYLSETDPELKKALGTQLAVQYGLKIPGSGSKRVLTQAEALKLGEIPENAVIVNPKDANGAGGPAAYFMPVQTAQGIFPFNARTGSFGPRLGDLKPSAGMADKIALGETTLFQIQGIRDLFNPDWTGPLAGRYKTTQLAVAGERGDEGLATFAAGVSALKNQTIKDITGAQMSEPEAARILQQIPTMENPPDVFKARLDMTERNRQYLLDRQKAIAFGRNPDEVPKPETMATPAKPETVEPAPKPKAAVTKPEDLRKKWGY